MRDACQGMDRVPSPVTRDLLASYLAGDKESERRLFVAHWEWLVERAGTHRLMPVLRARMSEEEVANETLLRALESGLVRRFDAKDPGDLRRGLWTVMDRQIKDCCRREGAIKRGANVRHVSYDEGDGSEDGPGVTCVSTDPTPTSQARANELIGFVRATLNDRDWRIWHGMEVEVLDSATMAARLGGDVTPAAVRGALHRARAKVLAAMEARFGLEG